jgi:hypothetical protein
MPYTACPHCCPEVYTAAVYRGVGSCARYGARFYVGPQATAARGSRAMRPGRWSI